MEMKKPAKWRGDLEQKMGYEQKMWHKRIVAMKEFLDSEDKTVMDLGAGAMHLRRLLPEGVRYYPVDYKKFADDTIVCDFNKKEFPPLKVNAIVAAGILDYIEDQRWFLDRITESCDKCAMSYKGNVMTVDEMIKYMKQRGFAVTKKNRRLSTWPLLDCFERITPKKLARQWECTGCGTCANACPHDAIEMRYNEDGFLKPHIIESKCIECQRCVKTCPALRPRVPSTEKPLACYAVWANDEIRMHSSSGGMFSVLSKYVLERGGRVFGAVWDEEFFCHIREAKEWAEILPMRYSKYVQSNTGYTFRQVKELLSKNIPVAYFGLPCQIAGLKSYLRGKTDGLITIDLVCFCSPSNVHFRKYLEEEYGIANVKDVRFRDKSSSTHWAPTSYCIDFKNNTSVYPNGRDDPYQRAFHGVLARNDTCDDCLYYNFPRPGDFTLGDFWGAPKNWVDPKGTSVVLTNTRLAENIMNELLPEFKRYEKVPLEWCLNKGNRIGGNSRPSHPYRFYFRELLKKNTVRKSVDRALGNHHDIGLVALINDNLGNNLTNYALWQHMTDLGYDVLLIGNPVRRPQPKYIYEQGGGDARIWNFLKNPYPNYAVLPPTTDYNKLRNINALCDKFVVGSDQIWRSKFISEFLGLFAVLDWVDFRKYKMSYGTSFGVDIFSPDEKLRSDVGRQLSRFQSISVREDSGVKILNEVFGLRGEHVLDPVFLLDQKYYDAMTSNGKIRLPDRPYVGAYFLDPTPMKVEALKKASDQFSSGVFHAIGESVPRGVPLKILSPHPAVEEWLAMVKYSEFLLTDSFHGTCLALIFRKPFCVIYDQKNWRGWTRFQSILRMFHLESRVVWDGDIKGFDELLRSFAMVDYEKVLPLIDRERKRSSDWLQESLELSKHFRG